ncbi:hypothetical protein A1O1_04576 [Capronia coronata CBS 617.96]|uniref:Uncharacterized protein n=1 Tax=Capronia coronata CBS 617.96 TaxID=1182541 RepID=W9Y4A4_9EURO|nr:uncharacterized protein A1O1_04576 [Capronia coronata CBS 617.96]EXJ87652.1 hypothetical protein A1O1_04576 [Capronia coronata CBS 617.96]
MPGSKQTVLITGCLDGGLGAALAIAFHKAGLHVYATARNPARMTQVAELGIETLTLDVLSESSIAACVSKIPRLDILVNKAGAAYSMPVTDMSIPKARKLFDLNAFLPLLLKSKGIIVNQTSIAASLILPLAAAYGASKAAMAHISETLRLELQPFGITVIELKTGLVRSNLIKNHEIATQPQLPENLIYTPAKEQVETALRQERFVGEGLPADQWATAVTQDILQKQPPPVIWRGDSARLARVGSILPFGFLDGTAKKATGFDLVEIALRN